MNLYFKDINATGSWNDPDHWFEDAAATIAHNAVPWAADDATKGYDLYRSTDSVTSGETVNIDVTIGSGFVITGECFIGSDAGSTNGGGIQNTTSNAIYGGTWSGENFDNNSGTIFAGKFSGDAFNNGGLIEGGLFIDIVRSSLGGTVNGGNFVPSGVTVLFFKNDDLDSEWTNSNNWFSDYEGTTSAGLTDAPWTEDDATKDYWLARSLDSDLVGDDILISNPATIGSSDGSWAITGGCAIGSSNTGSFGMLGIANNIYDGTFFGFEITNVSGGIHGGTFVGQEFNNMSIIYGGTFSGEAFINAGTISDGVFSGDNFINAGTISDGVFSGANFSNQSGGTIYDGTFSGDFFDHAAGASISGGTFSGDSSSSNSNIYGGTFTGDNFGNSYDIYGGLFTGEYLTNGGDIWLGVFTGAYLTNTLYIRGGVFSGIGLTNTGEIRGGIFSGYDFNQSFIVNGGFWLENGSMDVDLFEYSSGTTPIVSGHIRITGSISNPEPYDLASGGFMTLRIPAPSEKIILNGGIIF